MKRATLISIGITAVCAVCGAMAGNLATNTLEDQVRVLGEDIGEPVETGFVFVDGRYIESPYRVSRRGASLCINEHVVLPPVAGWPPLDLTVDKDPGVPTNLTEKSTFEDIERSPTDRWYDAPLYRKVNYISQHKKGEEAVLAKMAWYKSLPFVESVKRLSGARIQVRTKSGEVRNIWAAGGNPQGGGAVPPEEDFALQMNHVRKMIENQLRRGECVMHVADNGQIRMDAGAARDKLPQMIQALGSNLSRERKIERLDQMGVTTPSRKAFSEALADNFVAAPQLTERLKALDAAAAQAPAVSQPAEK